MQNTNLRPGKILVAQHGGTTVLKLVGDVRLTMSTMLDDFIATMFDEAEFASVSIDLTEADGLDSTTLGLLAKIAIKARQQFHFTPLLVCGDPSIRRLLDSMCFNTIFDIREQSLEQLSDFGELPVAISGEEEVKEKVLEAHRLLMGLSDENAERFHELVCSLEAAPTVR
ncbi:MAG: STAS domain-containing protein [Pseudomonadales bacterium]